jgi:hypothetical protein
MDAGASICGDCTNIKGDDELVEQSQNCS